LRYQRLFVSICKMDIQINFTMFSSLPHNKPTVNNRFWKPVLFSEGCFEFADPLYTQRVKQHVCSRFPYPLSFNIHNQTRLQAYKALPPNPVNPTVSQHLRTNVPNSGPTQLWLEGFPLHAVDFFKVTCSKIFETAQLIVKQRLFFGVHFDSP